MDAHSGHRERMRTRFLRHGLDNFDDHSVLELLLFYALPRQDTNALAHRLLEAFGTLAGVFDATPEALMTVPGLGANAAALIRLVPETARRYLISKTRPGDILENSEKAGAYILPLFLGCQDETAYLVSLDAKMKVLDCRLLCRGTTTALSLSIRRVVQIALSQNASSVLLAHNHVGGVALPSEEDKQTTARLQHVLAEVGITLVDHLIVADSDFVSMSDSGYLSAE